MVFAHLFPAATVVALEPQMQNCLLLKANTLSLPNVRVHCKGLWNKETRVAVVPGSGNMDWGWHLEVLHTSALPGLGWLSKNLLNCILPARRMSSI